MGLDVSFGVPGGEEPFFYLRNHSGLFELMCTPEPETIDKNYTDFMVSSEMIDRMEDRILADFGAAGLSRDLVPQTLPEDFHDWDAREMEWEDLLPCYLRILEDLGVLVDQHGYLICSWSA
jgi:hypothetical protein